MSKNDERPPVHGGEMLVKALEAEGIEWVFGIPGGEFLPFLEAIDRLETRITYVGTRHEQACGHMADAVARVTGKPAVACATVGPGLTHLIPGVDSAWADNIPMLVVHPSQSPKFEDHHRLQGGIDQLTLLRPLVKYQKHIDNPNRIVWAAQKCFKELFSGRPGPVQLEVREDAFYGEVEDYGQVVLPPEKYRSIEPPAGNPKLIERACEILSKAQRPLIISGGGVTISGRWDILQKLSLEFEIPCATTFMGIGTMSTHHPTYVGATVGSSGVFKAVHDADVILALGCKFSYVMAYGKSPVYNPDAQLIQVDIDPQMIGKNRPVALGILGDVGVVLQQIYDCLKQRKTGKISAATWMPSLLEARKSGIDSMRGKTTSDRTPIPPQRVINDLLNFMKPSDILCIDGGDTAVFTMAQIDNTKPRDPRTVLMSIGFGHLGTAIPYAIGAKLAKPDKRVFFITGDGSYLFNIHELDTAIRYETPFVGVVLDNCAWGMIKNRIKAEWGRKRTSFCVDLPETEECSNYVRITQGFGAYSERVTDPAEITPALQRAVDSRKPAVIVVPIEFVEPANSSLLKSLGKLKF